MTTPIDLSQLPTPRVIERLDYEQILDAVKAELLALWPADRRTELADTLALESEPLTKLLEAVAYRETLLRQRINEASRAVMLAYAAGSDLDQIGANYEVERRIVDDGDPDAVPPVPPTLESDTEFRRRIQLSFEGFSTAGPAEGYVFHALGAEGAVLDASATSPAPGEVLVAVLSRDGNGAASPEILEAVEAAVTASAVRPLTDRVAVQSAEILEFAIQAELHIYPGPDAAVVMDAARSRLADYLEGSRQLGRAIARSAIVAALHAEGVSRVDLLSPQDDIEPTPAQAGYCVDVVLMQGESP